MIEQKTVSDLATAYPLIAHAVGSAAALVDLTPYSLPVIKGSKGYQTFTVILANRDTKALTAVPLIYQKENIPAPSTEADATFFSQQAVLDSIAKYGQSVSATKSLLLNQTVPTDDLLWQAAGKMGEGQVVVLYQMGENEAPLESIPAMPTPTPHAEDTTEATSSATPPATSEAKKTATSEATEAETPATPVEEKLVWKIAVVVTHDVSGMSAG